ncbi:metal ABC transporter substrate-binding protein [Vogesella oryzae]|uniref:metal ABC transporter substrate-binding protein n=1 Tax=Vogesella oryzae TaxID=1735285 RepID=UPI001583B3C6|nr:metal ABC transporter substrate-binding protein [Vogesella oryzae]
MRKFFAMALLLSPLFAVAKVPVVASFSIVADITREIGGDQVEVQSLVGPDQDAHVFQPAPADVKKLAAAKVFVVSGLGFEGWMPRMSRAASFKGLTVTAGAKVKPLAAAEEGHHEGDGHDHGSIDPHAWHNPQNVMLYVDAIADGLSKADPAGAGYFHQRADAYKAKLKALDGWAAQQFAAVPLAKRKVLTSHEAFGYLAARYQIRFMAPQGISTEAEASAKAVARLIQQVKKEQVKAVFFENMADKRLLQQLSNEAGVKVGGKLYADALSSDGKAGNYLQLFRSNVETLLSAMR